MRRFFSRVTTFAPLAAVLLGCSAGRAAFHEGRLPAAAAELRALEPAARRAGRDAFAHYALERGLVELGLGNARTADAFLGAAKRAHDVDPRLFDDRERGALLSAWRSLGRMPGEQR